MITLFVLCQVHAIFGLNCQFFPPSFVRDFHLYHVQGKRLQLDKID